MKNILVVEDEQCIQDIIAYNLEKEGFKLFTCNDGVEAIELLEDGEDIDLILMDIMMPKMDGFECLKTIRNFSNIPIIMVTAMESEDNIVKGFEMGANDYVVKPFSMRELIARVKANIRTNGDAVKRIFEKISLKGVVINPETNEFVKGNIRGNLSDVEMKIFMYLYNNANTVKSREDIIESIWGSDGGYDNRTVDVNVRRLREKIEQDDSQPLLIRTSRGKGYYFDSEMILNS